MVGHPIPCLLNPPFSSPSNIIIQDSDTTGHGMWSQRKTVHCCAVLVVVETILVSCGLYHNLPSACDSNHDSATTDNRRSGQSGRECEVGVTGIWEGYEILHDCGFE